MTTTAQGLWVLSFIDSPYFKLRLFNSAYHYLFFLLPEPLLATCMYVSLILSLADTPKSKYSQVTTSWQKQKICKNWNVQFVEFIKI